MKFPQLITLMQSLSLGCCFIMPSTLSAMDELPPIYCIDGTPIPFFVVTAISDSCDNNAIQPSEKTPQTWFASSPLCPMSPNHETLHCTESPITQYTTPEPMNKNKESDKPQSSLDKKSINHVFHTVTSIAKKSTKSKNILMTHFALDELKATHDIMCHLCKDDQMIFTNQLGLQNHITACHLNNQGAKRYQKKCPECGQLFYSYNLSKHIVEVHFKPHMKK